MTDCSFLRRGVFVRAFLAMLWLGSGAAVGGGARPAFPAQISELPSDPACCGEAKAVLATVPDLNLSPPAGVLKLPAGRKQLFLDNFVLASVKNVKRQLHQPRRYGPVVRPDQAWEGGSIQIRTGPSWNPEEKLWMMFYLGGYATSRDGLHWDKPMLGLQSYKGSTQNNIMLPRTTYTPDSFYDSPGHFSTKIFKIEEGAGANYGPVFYDARDPDPHRRYKGFATKVPFGPLCPAISPDGRHWQILDTSSVPSADEYHMFHDESRNLFVATVKHLRPRGRSVYLSVSKDFDHWTEPRDCLVFHADQRDQELGAEQVQMHLHHPELRQPVFNKPDEYKTDIYNLPVFAYEGLYVGMPTVFNHSGNTKDNSDGFSMVELAVSRNLLDWERVGNREKFIPLSPVEGGRNYDVAQLLAANQPIITKSEIWIYYSGLKWRDTPAGIDKDLARRDTGAVCLAKLRLDGFVSLDAGATDGYVLTKPLLLEGKSLHFNVDASEGEASAEILDAAGMQPLRGFSLKDSVPVRGDTLDGELKWTKAHVSELSGKTVRLRFKLHRAGLYAFWTK